MINVKLRMMVGLLVTELHLPRSSFSDLDPVSRSHQVYLKMHVLCSYPVYVETLYGCRPDITILVDWA